MKPSEALKLAMRYEATYGSVLSDESRSLWCEVLADVRVDDATRALDELAAIGNFPPTVQQIRLRARERGVELPEFGTVFAELIDAANTCDYFDPNPPSTLSPVAYTLARSLGWADFRVSDPTSTYYVHQAQQRYEEIATRVQRRLAEGLPAFDRPETPELSDGVKAIVDGIGLTDT